jgi:hypothetical protein
MKKPLYKVCCICGKIKINNIWTEGLRIKPEFQTHGYCPKCYSKEKKKLLKKLKGLKNVK